MSAATPTHHPSPRSAYGSDSSAGPAIAVVMWNPACNHVPAILPSHHIPVIFFLLPTARAIDAWEVRTFGLEHEGSAGVGRGWLDEDVVAAGPGLDVGGRHDGAPCPGDREAEERAVASVRPVPCSQEGWSIR